MVRQKSGEPPRGAATLGGLIHLDTKKLCRIVSGPMTSRGRDSVTDRTVQAAWYSLKEPPEGTLRTAAALP